MLLPLVLVGLFACVTPWQARDPIERHRVERVEGAGVEVGAEVCGDCHDSYGEHLVVSRGHDDCESCHGPAQLHVYTAKAKDIRFPGNEDCAGCHQIGSRTLLGWSTSEHERSDVLCTDCHDTHNREPLHVRQGDAIEATLLRHAGPVTRMCSSCHPEVAAQFDLPSHHPIQEGMLSCTDCHDPHQDRRLTLGAATQVCLDCHQDVAGPWIYEHPPATEDCGYCHVPHGASADFLMEATEPAACISCHTLPIAGAVHTPYAFSTGCTDCHNSIHGSYSDPHLRR